MTDLDRYLYIYIYFVVLYFISSEIHVCVYNNLVCLHYIESAGVPNTVFKGNQRKYTKECLIIYDKKTGVVTLEKLNHNIQVKKTR